MNKSMSMNVSMGSLDELEEFLKNMKGVLDDDFSYTINVQISAAVFDKERR